MLNERSFQLHRKSFRKWLQGFDPDDSVGYALHSNSCPIANFIYSTKEGVCQLSADPEEIFFYDRNRTYYFNRSRWALRFIEQIDHIFFKSSVTEQATAGICLEILDRIDEEMKAA